MDSSRDKNREISKNCIDVQLLKMAAPRVRYSHWHFKKKAPFRIHRQLSFEKRPFPTTVFLYNKFFAYGGHNMDAAFESNFWNFDIKFLQILAFQLWTFWPKVWPIGQKCRQKIFWVRSLQKSQMQKKLLPHPKQSKYFANDAKPWTFSIIHFSCSNYEILRGHFLRCYNFYEFLFDKKLKYIKKVSLHLFDFFFNTVAPFLAKSSFDGGSLKLL